MPCPGRRMRRPYVWSKDYMPVTLNKNHHYQQHQYGNDSRGDVMLYPPGLNLADTVAAGNEVAGRTVDCPVDSFLVKPGEGACQRHGQTQSDILVDIADPVIDGNNRTPGEINKAHRSFTIKPVQIQIGHIVGLEIIHH